jgi:outer membrane receptor protein involved in Fe transport
MEVSGIKSITEIAALTPGINFGFQPGVGDYLTNIVIRGVAGTHDSTTGVFVDDTRMPTIRGDTYLLSFPFTFDLDRVEVLRGSQGALLGEGTEGGAVRFIMKQPNLSTFDGLVRTDFATTEGGEASYEVGAAAGGPITDDILGFRVSGWYRLDGGYVDRVDPFTGATVDADANRSTAESVRAALTWVPTASLSITPSLIYQSVGIRNPGSFDLRVSDAGAGELRDNSLLQRPYNESHYLASLKLVATLWAAELSTVTSYFQRSATATLDASPEDPVDYADATSIEAKLNQRVFSQEVRLTSTEPGAALTWLVGMWYSSERNHLSSRIDLQNADEETSTERTQLASFGQMNLRMTKHFTASAALRIERSKSDSVTRGPPNSRAEVTQTPVAPRFDITYQKREGNLYYLSAAKGYGSGSTAATVFDGCASPIRFGPDTVWSYEMGAKTDLLDRRAQFDASVFHIRWSNDASSCSEAAAGGVTATTAVSDGFDLAARMLLSQHVTADLNIAYTDAHYTKTARLGDVVVERKGDAVDGSLGYISPWNITGSIEYGHALFRDVAVNLRAEDVFHSHNPGPFDYENPDSLFHSLAPGNPEDPSTNVINLRADIRWQSVEVALFVNNASNSQPALTQFFPKAATFRPRTVGVTANWRF